METQQCRGSSSEETMTINMEQEEGAAANGNFPSAPPCFPDISSFRCYKNIHPIGKGGMGIVYGAEEPGLYRKVAIKVLRAENRHRPGAVENLLREGRMTAQIDHPNIVPVYRIGTFEDAGVYFSMRRVSGKTLSIVLQHLAARDHRYERKYTLRHLLEIFISICNGVAFAHSKGIIHRDLKPSNIMLGKYGEVMVMDWGVALYREPEDRKDQLHLGETGGTAPAARRSISGTPCYMSPEQVKGDPDMVDARTDQYALGAILYSILTLRPAPLDPKQEVGVLLQKVVSGDIPRPRKNSLRPRVPRELEAIVRKAMSRAPEDRYRSVRALRDDVRHYLDSMPVKAYHPLAMQIFNFLLRRPVVPATVLAALISFAAVHGIGRIMDYTHYSAELKLAEEHLTAANLDTTRLQGMLAPDSPARHNPEVWRSGGAFESTRQHFLWHSRETCSALERATYKGAPEEAVAPLADVMYSNIVNCIVLRGDTASALNLYQNLSPLLKHRLDHILLRNPENAARLQLILAGETETELDSDLPGEISMEHWENGSSNFLQLGEPLLSLHLPSGFNILYQKTFLGELVLPVTLTAGESRQIRFEAPPVTIPDAVYIQKGTYRSQDSVSAEMRLDSLESFYLDRNEVTIAAYRAFWETLPEEQKKAYLPQLFIKGDVEPLFRSDGTLHPAFQPSMPVVGITAEAAEAYCRFQAGKYGLEGRLPSREELVKAARASDTRLYPWGSTPPEQGTRDISPYGVCDLVAGVRELCYLKQKEKYACFGGSFQMIPEMLRISTITPFHGGEEDVGFRCAYQIPAKKKEGKP